VLLEPPYLLLPAYGANMAPPFVKYWRGWNRAIHRRLLGEHKTVMGFALGVAAGVLVALGQSQLSWVPPRLEGVHWLAFSFGLAFATHAGVPA
jgi:CDP-2,3-bis-(O-geranylgeranyl)-sn-glycerol synthase